MAARLLALSAGRPLPPGFLFLRFLVLISFRGWVDPRSIVRPEELGKLEKIHLIGTRSRDLPVCSIVPQPLRYRVFSKFQTVIEMPSVQTYALPSDLSQVQYLDHVYPSTSIDILHNPIAAPCEAHVYHYIICTLSLSLYLSELPNSSQKWLRATQPWNPRKQK
jgi:hypothetical protein